MTSSPRSIIAVDVGEKRLHLAVGPPGAPRSLRLSTSAERWPDRLDDLSVALLRVAAAEAAGPGGRSSVVVLIEGPSFASVHRAHQLGAVHGILLWSCAVHGYPAGHIPPSSIKRFATGKGNASKAVIVSSVSARTGRVYQSDDSVDALALWCLGWALAGQPHPLGDLPKGHLQALSGQALPETPTTERIRF